MTDNPGGKYRNYDYGYIPRDEKIPEGYTRTWRPCMECNSSVTYIDKDKVWHCLKCGWSCSVDVVVVSGSAKTSDAVSADVDNAVSEIESTNVREKAVLDGKNTADSGNTAVAENKENYMAKGYTEKEMSIIRNGLETGKKITEIADEIGRDPSALSQKIKTMREQGKLPEGKRRKKCVLTADKDSSIVGTIPPVDFPEITAEYVKDLQGKLRDANLKLENEEANYEALELHVKGLEEQSKFYLKDAEGCLAKLKEANNRIKDMEARVKDANDLAYQFEEQVLDLQSQLKSQQEYIQVLEKPISKITPSRPISDTPHTRICNALQKAEEAGMKLEKINVRGFNADLGFSLNLVDDAETEDTQS